MSLKNTLEQQKANLVMTASKEELTLMLYDGALKFVNQAIIAIENQDFEKAHILIIKTENIINEFRATLRMEYEVAERMERMYVYMYDRLVEGNIKKDTNILGEVRDMIREFRDSWKEAMIIARKENAAKAK